MSVNIAEENYRYAVIHSNDLPDLLLSNNAETGSGLPGMPLQVNWVVYERLADLDRLLCITARDAGRLVGYLVFVISDSLHHAQVQVAEADVMWIRPAYRRGMLAVRMLAMAEQKLRDRGVDLIYAKTSLKLDVGALYRRQGFDPIEIVYRKDLRDGC